MKFGVPFGEHVLWGDQLGSSEFVDLLILHGAGTSNRERYLPIRQKLAQFGLTSLAFDFIGHGETSGALANSSLESRTRQALAVVSTRQCRSPLMILGASMGAYNAIKLTEHCQVSLLILIAPAVYTPKAYFLPFGDEFSQVIRSQNSWVDSDAWQIVSKYSGDLLLLVPENDTVIPAEIPKRLLDSATKSRKREMLIVPDAPHPLAVHLSNSPDKLNMIIKKILSFMAADKNVVQFKLG